MGSLFGDWPSYNPHNFSQLRPSDPSHPSQITPATYYPTHNRTVPPQEDQVITTEGTNILLRQFYQLADHKVRPKRPAPASLSIEHVQKQPRIGCMDGSAIIHGGLGEDIRTGSLRND